tara:strand:- start:435 stop:644 length:210 start_codon:yes stop_codon:yes gene_type:complete
MKVKLCEHRHEVTFTFTVIGFGNTEDEAVEEARHYAIRNWVNQNSNDSYEVSKVVKDRHSDLCGACEES